MHILAVCLARVTYEPRDGWVHQSLCGSVVEYRGRLEEGLMFDSSVGFRSFLCPTFVTWQITSFLKKNYLQMCLQSRSTTLKKCKSCLFIVRTTIQGHFPVWGSPRRSLDIASLRARIISRMWSLWLDPLRPFGKENGKRFTICSQATPTLNE